MASCLAGIGKPWETADHESSNNSWLRPGVTEMAGTTALPLWRVK
jgi:hypothetical protein